MLAIVFVAACDDATAPRDLERLRPSFSSGEPFTVEIGIDDMYDPTNGADLPTYAANTLVTVTVSGLTYMYKNWPEEQEGTLHATFDARGHYSTGTFFGCYVKMNVRFTYTGSIWGTSCSPPAQDPVSKTVLVRGAGRAEWTGAQPQTSGQCGVEVCWYYEGTKVVTVTPVQAELVVSASPVVLPAPGYVSWSTTPSPASVGGLNVPWEITAWRWTPDNPPGQTTTCPSWAKACQRVVYESGRMEVDGLVNGIPRTASIRVHVGPPEIDVTCTPASPIRGTPVVCEARPLPESGVLAVTGWRFEGPELSVAIVEQTSTTEWTGIAVTAGEVFADGSVDGVASTGSTTLAVSPRNWSQDTVRFRLENLGTDNLPIHPTGPADLGNHEGFAEVFVFHNDYTQVPSGPNNGALYLIKVPVEGLSRIRVNYAALSVGSDFYLRQPTSAPTGSCTRQDVVPFVPLAEDHEGLTLSPTSHAGVLRNELNALAPQATEPTVALDFASLEAKV